MQLRAKLVFESEVREVPGGEILDLASPPAGAILWVDVEDPDEVTLQTLAETHDMHELLYADIRSEGGRAGVERIGEHLVMTFKALNFNTGQDLFDVVRVLVIVSENRVLTFRARAVRSIDEAWGDLAQPPSLHGPIGLIHPILVRLMGRYLEVLDELEEPLDELEPDIVDQLDPALPSQIFAWKRRLLELRKRIRPHRDALLALMTMKHKFVTDETRPYLRDVLDLVQRTEDRLVHHRDLLQGATELYMAGAAQETNEVMKTLSLVATVVLPLNILTGLYGTNFEVLPGSKVEGAFWLFILAMTLIGGGTGYYFRRKGWL